jgi:branched-chain amino acid transport system substrate-binding protein
MSALWGSGRGAFWLAIFISVIALAVAGCGDDDDGGGGAATTAQEDTTSAPAAAAPTDSPDPQPAVEPRSGGSGTPIKIAIMSECKGAFGSFDNQNMAGAVAALAQFAGAKPKNPNKPKDGFTGGAIGDHPLKLVGVGCGDDTADTAIKEVRRLMEQLDADVMIGPLSGDESIAVANYAKQHPDKTFVDGSAGAQDTTLKVQAPNFFRFNGDGAQWNAGLGDIAFNQLGWKTAAVVADDYSFGWTSAAGFIAEFCAVGGQVTKRIFPPLNTTDYSSYAQQTPTDVDGVFVAVGGAGLIPYLKAYEQAKGPIDAKKFQGNLFWGTPGQFEQLGPRVADVYIGGAGTAGDLDTPGAQDYANNIIGKWFTSFKPGGDAAPQASSTFT